MERSMNCLLWSGEKGEASPISRWSDCETEPWSWLLKSEYFCSVNIYWAPTLLRNMTSVCFYQTDSWTTQHRYKQSKPKSNLKLLLQFSSVAQSCPTFCDPMNHSTPGLPVHHQLPELTQTHVHQVGDAIQPSPPLSSPSPPAPSPSQHQGLFQWVSSSHHLLLHKHMGINTDAAPDLLFSLSVMFNSSRPHELQHTRLPYPSLSPGVCSNSHPLSQ